MHKMNKLTHTQVVSLYKSWRDAQASEFEESTFVGFYSMPRDLQVELDKLLFSCRPLVNHKDCNINTIKGCLNYWDSWVGYKLLFCREAFNDVYPTIKRKASPKLKAALMAMVG